jgi:hypothetical protein
MATSASASDSISVEGLIVWKGWWGAKSALLDESSILFKAKKLFTSKLIKAGMASERDLDRRNVHPHIELVFSSDEAKAPVKMAKFETNPNAAGQARKDSMQNSKVRLTPESLIIHEDHAEIALPHGAHMTMFYKAGLGDPKNRATIKQLWIETLKELAAEKI